MRAAGPYEEIDVVRAAQAGSEAAFALLVNAHRRSIVHFAYRLTNDRDRAEDIAQESFVRAYLALGAFVPRRRFGAWLFTIARNASISELRKRPSENRPLLADVIALEPGPEDVAVRIDEASRLTRALATLPEKYRIVLDLYYYRGFMYWEIAEKLAMPIGTIKTRIARAKRALRAAFASAESEERLPTAS